MFPQLKSLEGSMCLYLCFYQKIRSCCPSGYCLSSTWGVVLCWCVVNRLTSGHPPSLGCLKIPVTHPRYVQNGWWTYELCWPWHVRRMHYHTVAAPEAHIFRVLHTSEDSTQSLGFLGWRGRIGSWKKFRSWKSTKRSMPQKVGCF